MEESYNLDFSQFIVNSEPNSEDDDEFMNSNNGTLPINSPLITVKTQNLPQLISLSLSDNSEYSPPDSSHLSPQIGRLPTQKSPFSQFKAMFLAESPVDLAAPIVNPFSDISFPDDSDSIPQHFIVVSKSSSIPLSPSKRHTSSSEIIESRIAKRSINRHLDNAYEWG